MSKVYIAFDRVTENFHREKTVYISFRGNRQEAEAHVNSDEFNSFLTSSYGLNPRVVMA